MKKKKLEPYDTYKFLELKKWCIEQALRCNAIDDNGNIVQVEPVEMAQKIFDWVTK